MKVLERRNCRAVTWAAAVVPLMICCAPGLPSPHIYSAGSGYVDSHYQPEGAPDAGIPGRPDLQGHDYCRHLEIAARGSARAHDARGYVLGTLSLLALGTGTTLTAIEDSPSPGRKGVDLGLPLLGAALAYFAVAEFSRSHDANEAAGAATNAVAIQDDKHANELCLAAHSAWDTSRSSAYKAFAEKLIAPPSSSSAVAPSAPPPAAADAGTK